MIENIAAVGGDFDILGKGAASVLTAIGFGVALFLRNKFMERRAEKSENPPMQEWLREFLTAMTEDRRQSAAMFKEMAAEIRGLNDSHRRLNSYVEDAIHPALSRIESHTNALLQRRRE